MSAHEEGISTKDFGRLCTLIYDQCGIVLGPDKKTMLELRIKRRLRTLNLNTYLEYCQYLFGPGGQKDEIVHLIDVVSTNKTDFYREPDHFDFLVKTAVPDLMARNRSGRPLLFWSAGCSTGEEPYTLTVVLSEYAATHPKFQFKILATDISTAVLEKAERAVFTNEVVDPVPAKLRKKYFMRSRDPSAGLLRVVPELRTLVEFRRINFMDADLGLSEKADAFFCRNVIIYFDRATQERILQKLVAKLVPGGYAFLGHSETLHDLDVPVLPVAPAVYRKLDYDGA
jgi:chemotaxis protein methyltransferase CheR